MSLTNYVTVTEAFINWKKDFVGKVATLASKEAAPKRRLVTMTIDVDQIDVSGDEAILSDGAAVGYVSSGGFAHRAGQSMAMGYVAAEYADPDTRLEVEILGEFYQARVLSAPIYDPNGANMRV